MNTQELNKIRNFLDILLELSICDLDVVAFNALYNQLSLDPNYIRVAFSLYGHASRAVRDSQILRHFDDVLLRQLPSDVPVDHV